MMLFVLFAMLGQMPEAVVNEPAPAKRYLLALDVAEKALEEAKVEAALEAVEYSVETLQALGPAYKHGKHYKRAELRVRGFLRRTDSLAKEADLDDRPRFEAAHKQLSAIHDRLLEGVMSKKP